MKASLIPLFISCLLISCLKPNPEEEVTYSTVGVSGTIFNEANNSSVDNVSITAYIDSDYGEGGWQWNEANNRSTVTDSAGKYYVEFEISSSQRYKVGFTKSGFAPKTTGPHSEQQDASYNLKLEPYRGVNIIIKNTTKTYEGFSLVHGDPVWGYDLEHNEIVTWDQDARKNIHYRLYHKNEFDPTYDQKIIYTNVPMGDTIDYILNF
jgi:hypothetical protein